MTSEGRARPREGEEATRLAASTAPDDGSPPVTDTGSPEEDAGSGGGDSPRTRSRPSLPLVPTLLVLLTLLLAVAGYLWFTRPVESAVRTGEYAEALKAARSGVVDLTSFDHLTLDDDIEQARRVTTGDLQEESVAQLEERRREITDLQAVVNTEVVGAGVTRANGEDATVLLVIQSTQKSTASPQAQVVSYEIEVAMAKVDGRWRLSGIEGTEMPGE